MYIPVYEKCSNSAHLELHTVSYSSEKAYGGCVYIQSLDKSGNSSVTLLCAQSNFAPV